MTVFEDLRREQAALKEPPLPRGAKKVRPFTLKVGNWVEMEFDAKLTYRGIEWLRAKGGFGDGQRTYVSSVGRFQNWHPREDWVGHLPEVSLHVGRYWSDPDNWKHDSPCSMQEAMDEAIDRALCTARHRAAETADKLVGLGDAITRLEAA